MSRDNSYRTGGIVLAAAVLAAFGYFYLTTEPEDAPESVVSQGKDSTAAENITEADSGQVDKPAAEPMTESAKVPESGGDQPVNIPAVGSEDAERAAAESEATSKAAEDALAAEVAAAKQAAEVLAAKQAVDALAEKQAAEALAAKQAADALAAKQAAEAAAAEEARIAEAEKAKQAADALAAKQAAEALAAKRAAEAAAAEETRIADAEKAKQAAAARLAAENARIAIEKAAEAARVEAEAAAQKARAVAEAAADEIAAEKARIAAEQAADKIEETTQEVAEVPADVVAEPPVVPAVTPDVATAIDQPSVDDATTREPVADIAIAQPDAAGTERNAEDRVSGLAVIAAPETDQTSAVTSITAPSFDLVRVAPDGGSIIAGRAQPGSTVEITADGQVIGSATANARGEFVAMLTAPASEKPLSLGLIAQSEGGTRTASATNVLILSTSLGEPDTGETAMQAPILVRETAERIEIIQPAPLPVPDQVVIDTIGYDRAGAVEISGRGRPTFQVRLYMNGRFVEQAAVGDDGLWSLTLSDVAAGLYTLRVDEVDSDGKVASRAETPFQRIFPDQLPDVGAPSADRYTVQPGNNLWTIAKNRYGEGLEYWQIFRANKKLIRDPDLIYPGQIFTLPE